MTPEKPDPRADERTRRQHAQENRGDVVAGSGRAIEPRRLGQMVSARLEPEVVAELRAIAQRDGVSLSDLLRKGASLVIEQARSVPYEIAVEQTSAAIDISAFIGGVQHVVEVKNWLNREMTGITLRQTSTRVATGTMGTVHYEPEDRNESIGDVLAPN